jgi:hypothetical protein
LRPFSERCPLRAGKTHSGHGKSSHAKGTNIGIEPSRITPKLGFQPRSDGEVPTGHQQTLGRLFRFVTLIILLIGDDKIAKTRAGLSSVIGLKGGNRFLNSRQAIGVAENAEVYGRIVWTKGHRFFDQYYCFFWKS